MILALWTMLLGGVTLALSSDAAELRPPPPRTIAAVIGAFLLGPINVLWGLWGAISAGLHLEWVGVWPVYWSTFAAGALVQMAGGAAIIVRSIQLLADFKLPFLRRALRVLGGAALVIGAWELISGFLFFSP